MFGGPQASLTAEHSLRSFPWIDVIGIGEGENTIESIADALCTNKDFDNIKGVAYRKHGEIICSSELNLIADLDELPFIDYSLINMEDITAVALDVGRGCPFGCTYCSTKTFWKRAFRLKSSQRILTEIKYMINLSHKNNVAVIISNHDFDKTPSKDEIILRLGRSAELGADIPKIAVMPNSAEDVITLLDATRIMREKYTHIPLITVSMGDKGIISRLTGELFGSDLTFAAASKTSAPGQISVTELRNIIKLLHKNLK